MDTGTAIGGHMYGLWCTQVQPVMDTNTVRGGVQIQTQLRSVVGTITVYRGHSYCQLGSKIQTGTDTCTRDGHKRYSQWWT
jgi:hypothetical protein